MAMKVVEGSAVSGSSVSIQNVEQHPLIQEVSGNISAMRRGISRNRARIEELRASGINAKALTAARERSLIDDSPEARADVTRISALLAEIGEAEASIRAGEAAIEKLETSISTNGDVRRRAVREILTETLPERLAILDRIDSFATELLAALDDERALEGKLSRAGLYHGKRVMDVPAFGGLSLREVIQAAQKDVGQVRTDHQRV